MISPATRRLCFALATLAVSCAAAAASPAQKAVAAKLSIVERIWPTKDASAIVAALYTPHTEITGEGMPAVARGTAELTALVAHLIDGAVSTRVTIDKFAQLDASHAWTWVTWDVVPRDATQKPFKMKSLFVWEKNAGDWRVVADMFANGAISPAK